MADRGYHEKNQKDDSSDGEYDFDIQQPLGEDISFDDLTVDEEGGYAENEARNNIEGGFAVDPTSDSKEELHHEMGDHTDGVCNFYIKQRAEENRKLELYKAAIIGDWKLAEDIFYSYPNITPTTRINELGETALHLATESDQSEFVRNLVNLMNEEDLAIKTISRGNRKSDARKAALISEEQKKGEEIFTKINIELGETDDHGEGNTALCYAAVSGNITTASYMLEKDPHLSIIPGEGGILPIQMAASHGHHHMVRWLYEHHRIHDNLDNDFIDVLMAFIDCDIYDIAKKMVLDKPWLAVQANSKGLTALYAFARKSHITSNKFSNNRSFPNNYFSKRSRNKILRKQGLELVQLLLDLVMESGESEERRSKLMKKAIFRAATQGNHEFLTKVINLYPDLAFELDENHYTIFHIAVLHRNVDIFNIVHGIDSIKNVIRLTKDKEGNTILHLAGKLPLTGLEVVPGEALQLQRELFWFQEVKKLVGTHQMEAKNSEGKTPRVLFAEEHENLRRKGAEWMKATINSCMVVSTLVAGVAFTSAVTVPGGSKEDTGIPLLIDHIWFKTFAISNAISLIFSASSILLFLTIFTSHYSLCDFLMRMPTKFSLGLLLLSAAVQTMIIAFAAAFFIMFQRQNIGFGYPIAVIASIPVIFFSIQHSRLLFRYLFLLLAFKLQPESPFSKRWRVMKRLINWCH